MIYPVNSVAHPFNSLALKIRLQGSFITDIAHAQTKSFVLPVVLCIMHKEN